MTENPIVSTPQFKALTPGAQWLFYAALNEGPRRCGIVDVWPKRYAQLAAGQTEDAVTTAALELDRAGVVVFDDETDELLFPGYLAEVTPVNNPRMMIAVINSLAGVVSQKLIGVVIWELQQLQGQHPTAAVWDDDRVVEIMRRPAIDPSTLSAGAS